MANASLLEADRTSSPPTTGTSEPALAPGKRTLTDGMVVQRKLASDPSPAPAGGTTATAAPTGHPIQTLFGSAGKAGVVQRSEKPGDTTAGKPRSLDEELAEATPNYKNVFDALSAMAMLAMVKKLDGLRPSLPTLLAELKDTSLGSIRIRAAIHAVQLKGTTDAAKLKAVLDELDAAKVEIWERVDIAVYLEGSAGTMRKTVLDDLATRIDGGIAAIHDVEILDPSAPSATKLADRAKVAKDRDALLRLVHDYMRLVDAELVVLAGPDLAARQKQKARFDHFKMMRESEKLSDTMLHSTNPTELAAASKRKYELDALLADSKLAFRKPVGTAGKHGAEIYVVYEDCVKVGGSAAWLNNNPGNVRASSLATNLKNPFTIRPFAIFTTLELGFAAIPVELKNWRMESPGYYTLLRMCERWANGPGDNPDGYAAAVVEELNAAGIAAKGAKITKSTLLDDLTVGELERMGHMMARRVEIMKPGTTYFRSDVASQPWIGPLLGAP